MRVKFMLSLAVTVSFVLSKNNIDIEVVRLFL